jgi:oligopeptide transport system substrate-binding protein
MRGSSRSMAVAALSTLALTLSACGGGDDNGNGTGSADPEDYVAPTATGPAPDALTVEGCNPENPLVPQNTAETCGGDPQDLTVAKLVHYAVEDAAPTNDIAESIDTTDNQTFTVKIKPDYKFSDGTVVTAASFVDAWNYAAWGPNGYQSNYFFEPIEGYGDLQCVAPEGVELADDEDPCTKYPPKNKSKKLTGLTVVDDTTFTIKTTSKVSNLPVRLGYTAFAPLPKSFFDNPVKFGKKPASAGPYMVQSWTPNKEIVLVKNPNYSGDFPGQSAKITFKVYSDSSAAYADLQAGNLDVVKQIPTDALTDEKWLTDLSGRGATRSVGVIQMVGINPEVDAGLDDPELRKAISMAIDRQTIIDQIFAGTRKPATGWVSPVVDGYKAGQCGEACDYDPEKAKEIWDDAGGYDGDLTLTINGDADHGPWAEAACNSIRQALDVECKPNPTVDFATFLTDLGEREVKGLFRQGWQMDYPSIENFLVPLYSKGASSNYYDYDNADFARLTTEAAAAPTLEEANALYQEAEALLAEDMRIIPLWYATANIGWSERLNPVGINAFGVADFANITLK